ncbi:type II secretion system F family protein [bacterium]|nr:type II secretion system F family protein [bacterium]
MRRFLYSVKNKNNQTFQNYIYAHSIADAAVKLEKQGYIILEIKEEEDSSSYSDNYTILNSSIPEFSILEKKEFFNAFFHLYSSGVPIVETFKSISTSTTNIHIKNFCNLIVKKTEKGQSIRDALNKYSKVLGIAYTMLIAAGEESGELEKTLGGIIKNINKQEEIKSNLISSLTYPILIFCLALAVGMLFKFFILKVFASMGSGGLCATQVKFLLIGAIIKIVIIFAMLIGAVIFIALNRPLLSKIRSFFANVKLFGNIIKNFYFANFFNVLALSYQAGIPISESLSLSNSVVNLDYCKAKLNKAFKMVQNGCNLSTALATTNLFSNYAMSQVAAGENAGELDKMLKTVAYDYEKKLDTAIKVVLKLVEPTMMILIGIFVAYVVVTAYKSYYSGLMSMF